MSFPSLGLLPPLADALHRLGLHDPTPVQRVAIPAIAGGAHAIVVARTGTGKTIAYAAPILQRLREIEDAEGPVTLRARPRAIVLTSTRELVEQGLKDAKALAHGPKLRVRGVAGGMTESVVRQRLSVPVDLLFSNPPRLRALVEAGVVDLKDVRVLVVDEADTLLSPGQRAPVSWLLDAVPGGQRVFVSATLPEPIRAWLMSRPEKPALLLAKDAHAAPTRVRVRNLKISAAGRADAAHDVLVELPAKARGIVFTNTRENADAAAVILTARGHSVVLLHGAILPNDRKKALIAFRKGEGRILITTELAGRGLHLEGLAFVLNWELPPRPSDYLHRIGRVGRMGAKGEVINLYTERDAPLLREIDRIARGGKMDTGEPLRAPHERVAKQTDSRRR